VFVEPALASLADVAPSGPGWLHEIKFDGYRLQARIDGSKVKLLTRKGLDWTDSFKAVAEALKGLKLGSALIDGEAVVEEESGVSSFTALQEVLKSGRSDRMVFCAFNLLYLGGYDLTQVPLFDPKTLLAGCLDELPAGGSIRFSEHIETDGKAMLQKACRLGLEGILSKRKDQPYRSGPEGLVQDQMHGAPGARHRGLRALFYTDIADWVLPHLVGRPLSALIST
jgi:bifunctional non-homologous end joining protein LigD